MPERNDERLREEVRKRYGSIAQKSSSCCAPGSCCSVAPEEEGDALNAIRLGYEPEVVSQVPPGSNLGLGCGNPTALAGLRPGETVLDLGSGAGFDCFIAAKAVGPRGRVIGVDMTPEMVSKARANAAKGMYQNVEFRLGEIEHLPASDSSVDVVISNCVINLSPDKPAVFREAFRVLKPGGRLTVADIVLTAPLPEKLFTDVALYTGCLTGAALIEEIETMLRSAGFLGIRIAPMDSGRALVRSWTPGLELEDVVIAATILAVKPAFGWHVSPIRLVN